MLGPGAKPQRNSRPQFIHLHTNDVDNLRALIAFNFFTIPIQDSENKFNKFLESHKSLSVDPCWVAQGPNSFWSFCIDNLESAPPRSAPIRNRVDYKDVLTPEQFIIFAELRDLRKELAQAEAVPVYTIFTNEQLAKMVQSGSIPGARGGMWLAISAKRVTKQVGEWSKGSNRVIRDGR